MANDHWSMDKRIPIGILAGLLFQAGVLVWYGGQFAQRQNDTERRVTGIELVVAKNADESTKTSERLARMEEKMSAQSESLNRIESHMLPSRAK